MFASPKILRKYSSNENYQRCLGEIYQKIGAHNAILTVSNKTKGEDTQIKNELEVYIN